MELNNSGATNGTYGESYSEYAENTSNTDIYDDDYDNYNDLLYMGFSFERPIYLYIWEILVIMTCLINVVVICVLLRKKMRTPTYMVLVVISIADSLTGLVTIPIYINVFQRSEKSGPSDDGNLYYTDYFTSEGQDYTTTDPYNDNMTTYTHNMTTYTHGDVSDDIYLLPNAVCDAFLIIKFFVSASFHTVSVWLTLFLGIHRLRLVFSTAHVLSKRQTIIVCVSICVLAPFLHVYHLFKDSSGRDECGWQIETGQDCAGDCAYVWILLLLGHLIPAVLLLAVTAVFVYSFRKKSTNALGGNSQQMRLSTAVKSRQQKERRTTFVVIAIVVSFLIPEVPYSGFLLYNAISAHADQVVDLRVNRAIHAAYEILLVLSFNANFYIYTFMNERFRDVLFETWFVSRLYRVTCGRGGIRPKHSRPSSSSSRTDGHTIQMTNITTDTSN